MTDTITITSPTSPQPSPYTGNTVSLTIDSSGNCFYTSGGNTYQVAEITAALDSSSLTVTIAPDVSGAKAMVRTVTGVRGDDYEVTGGLTWVYSSNNLVLTFTTPGTSTHEIEWTFTDGSVPGIKLKVRHIRN